MSSACSLNACFATSGHRVLLGCPRLDGQGTHLVAEAGARSRLDPPVQRNEAACSRCSQPRRPAPERGVRSVSREQATESNCSESTQLHTQALAHPVQGLRLSVEHCSELVRLSSLRCSTRTSQKVHLLYRLVIRRAARVVVVTVPMPVTSPTHLACDVARVCGKQALQKGRRHLDCLSLPPPPAPLLLPHVVARRAGHLGGRRVALLPAAVPANRSSFRCQTHQAGKPRRL